MNQELLSICIPTRNRCALLAELLDSIFAQLPNDNSVRVYISDNASTDDTPQVAQQYDVTYIRRPLNSTGHENACYLTTQAKGKFIWLLGDDELLPKHVLPYILNILESRPRLGWFLNNPHDGSIPSSLYGDHANLRLFMSRALEHAPSLLHAPATISLNIFRGDCFSQRHAESNLTSSIYPQFYALTYGLWMQQITIHVSAIRTLIVRQERHAPPDNIYPPDTDYHARECMRFLSRLLILDIPPNIQSKVITRRWLRQLLRHPIRTAINNRQQLCAPGTLRKILNRLKKL